MLPIPFASTRMAGTGGTYCTIHQCTVGAAERTFDPCVGRDGDIIRAECSIFLGLLGGRFRSEAGEVSGLARLVV